ncbi:hypothetical protein PILCRDRAFT_567083 [Piloderma croceum F 1598]|uniref:Uncharacterized protein n=1 Tax=Piloderma croceum (strain F 1598) TaxID=765440 RepID=A0A0C3BP96_PILCF|nr:hypothetical protein PILCRDRAFT_567083 [Piloderma croceum F 1598]
MLTIRIQSVSHHSDCHLCIRGGTFGCNCPHRLEFRCWRYIAFTSLSASLSHSDRMSILPVTSYHSLHRLAVLPQQISYQ